MNASVRRERRDIETDRRSVKAARISDRPGTRQKDKIRQSRRYFCTPFSRSMARFMSGSGVA